MCFHAYWGTINIYNLFLFLKYIMDMFSSSINITNSYVGWLLFPLRFTPYLLLFCSELQGITYPTLPCLSNFQVDSPMEGTGWKGKGRVFLCLSPVEYSLWQQQISSLAPVRARQHLPLRAQVSLEPCSSSCWDPGSHTKALTPGSSNDTLFFPQSRLRGVRTSCWC